MLEGIIFYTIHWTIDLRGMLYIKTLNSNFNFPIYVKIDPLAYIFSNLVPLYYLSV